MSLLKAKARNRENKMFKSVKQRLLACSPFMHFNILPDDWDIYLSGGYHVNGCLNVYNDILR